MNDKDIDFARDYDELPSHASDNEYLYLIHFRLGAANSILQQIRAALYMIAIALAGILGMLWRHSGEWPF